jgi:hypothetical protein
MEIIVVSMSTCRLPLLYYMLARLIPTLACLWDFRPSELCRKDHDRRINLITQHHLAPRQIEGIP